MLGLVSLQETEQIGQTRLGRAAAGSDGILGAIELDQADVAHLWHEHMRSGGSSALRKRTISASVIFTTRSSTRRAVQRVLSEKLFR